MLLIGVICDVPVIFAVRTPAQVSSAIRLGITFISSKLVELTHL